MKKSVAIGIVAAIVSIGVAVALSFGGGPKGEGNGTPLVTNSQNITTSMPQAANNITTATSTPNSTRHFSVTLQERVGVKTK
ncbi:MAG: hypothetical protein KGI25_06915 [Thaumarchaeota archaeon]|nr:hypothetical protein [Nitrososphaerota archaeon]